MFMKTNAIFLSGSAISSSGGDNSYDSNIIDASSWKKVQMFASIGGGVAGTASLYVQNLDKSLIGGPIDQPAVPFQLLASLAIPENAIVTSSILDINAKWAGVVLDITSGSSDPVTGSAVVNLAFNNW